MGLRPGDLIASLNASNIGNVHVGPSRARSDYCGGLLYGLGILKEVRTTSGMQIL